MTYQFGDYQFGDYVGIIEHERLGTRPYGVVLQAVPGTRPPAYDVAYLRKPNNDDSSNDAYDRINAVAYGLFNEDDLQPWIDVWSYPGGVQQRVFPLDTVRFTGGQVGIVTGGSVHPGRVQVRVDEDGEARLIRVGEDQFTVTQRPYRHASQGNPADRKRPAPVRNLIGHLVEMTDPEFQGTRGIVFAQDDIGIRLLSEPGDFYSASPTQVIASDEPVAAMLTAEPLDIDGGAIDRIVERLKPLGLNADATNRIRAAIALERYVPADLYTVQIRGNRFGDTGQLVEALTGPGRSATVLDIELAYSTHTGDIPDRHRQESTGNDAEARL